MDVSDLHDQDFGEEAASSRAFALVGFWESYARVLQATGMAVTAFFGISEDRRAVFNQAVLEPASLSALASMLQKAMSYAGVSNSRELPARLRELAERRNRLAHDALTLDLSGAWPEMRVSPAFSMSTPKQITTDELCELSSTCTELEDHLLAVLPALVHGDR